MGTREIEKSVRIARIVLSWVLLCAGSLVGGEIPLRRWAVLGTFGGAGVRWTPQPALHFESRLLLGDGIAGSLRGAWQWPNSDWKIRPLAGLELSRFSTYQGQGEEGHSLVTLVGGEARLSNRWSIQFDAGPGVFRLQNDNNEKDSYEYENVFNVSLNYYFGKKLHYRGSNL